jgi:hypothetical protein
MSLAFALMAAINGSAGSSARLTYGLKGTKPHRRQPDGVKILTAPGRRRKPSETLTCESRVCERAAWPEARYRPGRPAPAPGSGVLATAPSAIASARL